jgi:hypothetical protein
MLLASINLPRFQVATGWKKIAYLSTFFIATPLTLVISLFALLVIDKHQVRTTEPSSIQTVSAIDTPRFGSQVYAALPTSVGEVKGEATAQDARFEIVRQYLHQYNSPLEPYTQNIIDASEKYEIDYRLLVAIAQQESNLCKKIPENSYNCWGWGIHSRGTLHFPDYPTAIDTVSQGLKENYIDRGYDTPEKIMQKYTPSSNGSWANGVSTFLNDME